MTDEPQVTNALEDVLANGTPEEQAYALLSIELDRLRGLQQIGYQYAGKRDVYTVAGYPRVVQFNAYMDRYLRQPEARRVIDMPAQTTWRNPPEIQETGKEGEDTEFTDAFEELRQEFRLWHVFERADRQARLGRYGVLLIGVAGTDEQMIQPLPRLNGPEDVLYVEPYDEGNAQISTFDEDPRSPRFGEVERYRISFSSGDTTTSASREVHHSRTIHIVEDSLRDRVYGSPALQPVLNPLISLEKVSAATGEAYWQLADKILVGSIDKDAQVSASDRKKLGEALEEMMHDLRRQIVGQSLDLSWLGGDTPDPINAAKLYMMQIASAKGIPYRVMFGNETGERASGEDQKQYLGTIAERQQRFAEPVILRAFIDRLIDAGGLPRPAEGYEVVWPTLWETPEREVAETDRQVAETAKALTVVGGDPLKLVDIDEEGRLRMAPRLHGEPSPFDLPEPEDELGPPEAQEPDIAPDDEEEEMEEEAEEAAA